jgi:mono/diheme cytochrome c family protein
MRMPLFPGRSAFAFFLLCSLLLAQPAAAQRAKPEAFPDAPGKEVLLAKCFQCHAPTMWQDHRQDRRGWESVLYRMVGRGALWTEDEIKTMADYLAAAYPKK